MADRWSIGPEITKTNPTGGYFFAVGNLLPLFLGSTLHANTVNIAKFYCWRKSGMS